MKNKWTLNIKNKYTISKEIITRTDIQAIPPNNENLIEILDKYNFNSNIEYDKEISNIDWTLNIKNEYSIGGEIIIENNIKNILPTEGDRIDVIGTSGKYYTNITKGKFSERVSKESLVSEKDPKKRKEMIDNIDYTPRIIQDDIELIINIKKGEIKLKHKF